MATPASIAADGAVGLPLIMSYLVIRVANILGTTWWLRAKLAIVAKEGKPLERLT